jgi:hypothetical protein
MVFTIRPHNIGEHVVDQIVRLVTATHRSAPAKRVHCVGAEAGGSSQDARMFVPKAVSCNQAERPLRRTAGVLRFRSSTDGIFSCTLMRIKICKRPVN